MLEPSLRRGSPYQNHDDNNDKNRQTNTKTDPLLLSRSPGAVDRGPQFNVCTFHLYPRVVSLRLSVLNHSVLLDDHAVQVLEHLGQLHHGALDLLNGVVALAHVGQRALRLASAVGAHERLLEDLHVAAGLGDFA